MFYDDKRQYPEVQEWCYRMINDPDYFENRRFKDTIDDYKIIIKEFEKLYEQTSATYRYVRARIKWNEKIKKRFGRLRLNMRYLRSIK